MQLMLEIKGNFDILVMLYIILFILQKKMNFSFELQWAALTGNVNPEAMMWMSTILWAFFGWVAIIWITIYLAIMVFMIISRWRLFKKAWLPGWGILIPVYNRVLMFKLWGLSGRWALSILFPPVFLIAMIVNYFRIPTKFWKHWAYGFGILFLKIVFIPILAFDNSKYLGKKTTKAIVKNIAKTTPVAKAPAKKVVAKKVATKKPAAKKPIKKVKTLTKKK